MFKNKKKMDFTIDYLFTLIDNVFFFFFYKQFLKFSSIITLSLKGNFEILLVLHNFHFSMNLLVDK